MIRFLSAPRCGSTWVFEYIKNFNIKNYDALTFPQDEFLNRDFNVWLERNNIYRDDWKDLDSKLKFLEENPKYTYKTHVNHVKDRRDRYLDLVKDNHVVILKRRDTWRAFLSFLVRKHLAVNNIPTGFQLEYCEKLLGMNSNEMSNFLSRYSITYQDLVKAELTVKLFNSKEKFDYKNKPVYFSKHTDKKIVGGYLPKWVQVMLEDYLSERLGNKVTLPPEMTGATQ